MSVPEVPAKAAVSVSEMAELCELSRSRWYELVEAGVFPTPVVVLSSKRPIYDRPLIEKCLEIRQSGIGLSGTPVVFNRKSRKPASVKSRAKISPKQEQSDSAPQPILDAVKSLGLTTTAQAVADAIAALFPGGISDQEQGEVIRKTFLYLQGKRP